MKKLYAFIFFGTILVFSECKKKEEEPTACIDSPDVFERGQVATFNFCGEHTEEISWTTSDGGSGSGPTFNYTFPAPGRYTVTVTGSLKGKSATTSKEISYGTNTKLTWRITNSCFSGNTGIPNASFYKAYLYNDFTKIMEDVESGTENKALDSVDCIYSSSFGTIYAEFTSTLMPGSKAYVFVKGPNNYRNTGDLAFAAVYTSTNSAYGQINVGNGTYISSTEVDSEFYKFVRTKWKLKGNMLNNNNVPIADCNKDDILSFKMDGTWSYSTGADNCAGSSQASNGTYPVYNLKFCQNASGGFFTLTTLSGPFITTSCEYYHGINELKVNYTAGSVQGYFTFTPAN